MPCGPIGIASTRWAGHCSMMASRGLLAWMVIIRKVGTPSSVGARDDPGPGVTQPRSRAVGSGWRPGQPGLKGLPPASRVTNLSGQNT
jgi:hypothetical protein